MIGEYFIDICLNLCCSLNTDKPGWKESFTDISIILSIYNTEIPEDYIPLEFKDKLDLLDKIVQERIENNNFNFEIIIAKVAENNKFKNLIPVLEEKRKEITNEEFKNIRELISNRRKLFEILRGKNRIQEILSQVDITGSGEEENIIKSWENEIFSMNENILKIKRLEDIDSASSLDLMKDDYSPMFKKIFESIDIRKTLPSGIKYIDNRLVSKGFENRRLYLIGGSSGIGKSVMLIHLICNAVTQSKNQVSEDGKIPTYLYITAENLIDETWIRFYCCLTNTPHETLIKKIRNFTYEYQAKDVNSHEEAEKVLMKFNREMQLEVKNLLNYYGANVIFKYVPMDETTVRDIDSIVSDVHSKNYLRCLYIDYLDLITTGNNLDYRFELTKVSEGFKNISITYNIPVITATQLNRDGYNPNAAPTLTQMSESMGKINNSDAVIFLNNTIPQYDNIGDTRYKILMITLLKQRNGPAGEPYKIGLPDIHLNGDPIFSFKYCELPNINNNSQNNNLSNSDIRDQDSYNNLDTLDKEIYKEVNLNSIQQKMEEEQESSDAFSEWNIKMENSYKGLF